MPLELNHRANIWAMKKLGVAWIISASAVGSLQAKYKPRDFVMIDQFVDRTKRDFEHTFFGRGIVAHVAFAEPIATGVRNGPSGKTPATKARVHQVPYVKYVAPRSAPAPSRRRTTSWATMSLA